MILIYLSMFLMTIMGAIASLFLKRASKSEKIKAIIFNPNLYIGGFLYLAAAVQNIWVLRYLDYSVVLPLTSLTYIWTMVLSYLVLKEKITIRKFAGVILILIGAVLISI